MSKKKPATETPPTDPDALLLGLIGWCDAMTAEVGKVLHLLNGCENRPGFGFAKDLSSDLLGVQDAIDNARPTAPHVTAADLESLLPKGGA